MKLQGITKASASPTGDELRTLALAEASAQARIFDYAEFYQITGSGDTPRKTAANDATGQARAVGAAGGTYTAEEADPTTATVALKAYGFEVKTDVAWERRGVDIGSQRAKDLKLRSGDFGRYLFDELINGPGSGNRTKGLKQLATDNSLNVVLGAAADGYDVPSGDSAGSKAKKNYFVEQIVEMVNLVDPTAIFCNAQTISRLQTIGREFVRTTTAQDIYGKAQQLSTFLDRPLVDTKQTSGRVAQIITNAETVGENDDCTSIYFVRYGEQEGVTIAGNSGIQVYDQGVVGTKYVTMLELDMDQVILDLYALRRLSGIRLTNA